MILYDQSTRYFKNLDGEQTGNRYEGGGGAHAPGAPVLPTPMISAVYTIQPLFTLFSPMYFNVGAVIHTVLHYDLYMNKSCNIYTSPVQSSLR